MGVVESVYEFVWLVVVDLCQYDGEQCVGGDVERYVEEDVGIVLIELVGEFVVGNVELEQVMVGWQCYVVDIVGVLGGDDMVV